MLSIPTLLGNFGFELKRVDRYQLQERKSLPALRRSVHRHFLAWSGRRASQPNANGAHTRGSATAPPTAPQHHGTLATYSPEDFTIHLDPLANQSTTLTEMIANLYRS